MKLLSIVSMMFAIQSWQFLSPTFAMDGAGPSGSGQGPEQAAWAEIEESLRAMQIEDAEVQRIKALIQGTPLYREFLIDGNKNARNYNGLSPLHYAAKIFELEVVKLLLQRGANIHAKDNDDNTPLHWAAIKGKLDVVRLLLDQGAKTEAINNQFLGDTPLHHAARNGHLEVVRLLLDRGANMNAKDYNGYTPLNCAVSNGNLAVVRLLEQRAR